MTSCGQCGFEYEALSPDSVAQTLRSVGARYRSELGHLPEDAARRRPSPPVWSVQEYACHVRDVLLVQRDRALLALVEDRPSFARMHREERVQLAHYEAHPIGTVAEHLEMAAALCALVFDGLPAVQWRRPLVYNFPAQTERDVLWLARHTVHECEHHLLDIASIRLQVQ